MIGLIQRVRHAKVEVAQQVIGEIDTGLLVLLGVERDDDEVKMKKLADKIVKYRVFSDQDDKMNLNLKQVGGSLLVVSQFTLAADTGRGLRPSFSSAATPEQAERLYLAFIDYCQTLGVMVQSGQFAADMQVSLTNDGPVTFQLKI